MQPHKNAWKFFLITFGISWLFWGCIILMGLEISQMPAPLLFAAGGVAPALAALMMVYTSQGKNERADFWRRTYEIKRIGWPYLLTSLLTALLLTALAAAVDYLLGGSGMGIEARFLAGPFSFLSVAVFLFFFGPLPEELGWRGYALGALQQRLTPLKSSLLLGMAWALWHLPLFFVRGSFQQSLLTQPTPVILFPLNILSQTLLMTWVFNRTARSTLSAVLFHYAVNLTGEALVISARGEVILAGLWAAIAVSLVFFGQFNRLPEQESRSQR